jgi:hypothetical protein
MALMYIDGPRWKKLIFRWRWYFGFASSLFGFRLLLTVVFFFLFHFLGEFFQAFFVRVLWVHQAFPTVLTPSRTTPNASTGSAEA